MFTNIGNKIKNAAKVFFGIGITISIVAGVTIISFDHGRGYLGILGLLTIALGICISRLSVLALYGFGQLVENSDICAKAFSGNAVESQETPINDTQQQ